MAGSLSSVTVAVPATSANLGPGFDSLGIALDQLGRVKLSLDAMRSHEAGGVAETIALHAAGAVFVKAGHSPPLELRAAYAGDLPVGRGLGASAVLRTGAIVAANELLGRPFETSELLEIAAELEGHADNVAPALYGGFQVVAVDAGKIVRVSVPFPAGLRAVVLVPRFEMPTEESRKLLPATLSRTDAVHNIGRVALLVAAMATGDTSALRVATQDALHQPARAKLFPTLFSVIDAAIAAGAACAFLSGGGSSVLALTENRDEQIAAAMLAAAGEQGTGARTIFTTIRRTGATVEALNAV